VISRLRPLFLAFGLGATALAAQQPQFRSGVDVVQLNVAVTSKNTVIADLTATDFEILDNGVRQEVTHISREVLPIDVTMVIDTSASVVPWVQSALLNAATKIRESLRPVDRLSLVTFNQRIYERIALQPVTEAGPFVLGPPSGQTSLNDSLATVLTRRPVVDRRQLAIVFSDGRDTTSLLSNADVLMMARRSQTATFFVVDAQSYSRPIVKWNTASDGLPVPSMSFAKMDEPGLITFVQQIAAATGGLVQLASLSNITIRMNGQVVQRARTEMLNEPFMKALDDFRTSYVVSYVLTGVNRPGWHEVSVRVKRPGGSSYQVRTRNGYTGG
jgi:VWFA-related protein